MRYNAERLWEDHLFDNATKLPLEDYPGLALRYPEPQGHYVVRQTKDVPFEFENTPKWMFACKEISLPKFSAFELINQALSFYSQREQEPQHGLSKESLLENIVQEELDQLHDSLADVKFNMWRKDLVVIIDYG